ncbi:MAG: hypothetical protein ACREFD_14975 [Stellaceae bacterium]
MLAMIAFSKSPRRTDDPVKPDDGEDWFGCWVRRLYLAGMALSVVVGAVAIATAYFADTAPRLSKSLLVLEQVGPAPGTWPALADQQSPPPLKPAQTLALLPRSLDSAEAPPITLSDLPPPASQVQ